MNQHAKKSLKMKDFPRVASEIIAMLRLMDNHLEAREWSQKIQNRNRSHQIGVSGGRPKRNLNPKHHRSENVKIIYRKAPRKKNMIKSAPRYLLNAKVMLLKNDRYVKGHAIDISKSGVFIRSERKIFEEDETVRLFIKPVGSHKYFKCIVTVARFNTDSRYPKGYGLKFVHQGENTVAVA